MRPESLNIAKKTRALQSFKNIAFLYIKNTNYFWSVKNNNSSPKFKKVRISKLHNELFFIYLI